MESVPKEASSPPGDEASYIADMLSQLADMAAAGGAKSLAATIRMAAVEASRWSMETERAAPGEAAERSMHDGPQI